MFAPRLQSLILVGLAASNWTPLARSEPSSPVQHRASFIMPRSVEDFVKTLPLSSSDAAELHVELSRGDGDKPSTLACTVARKTLGSGVVSKAPPQSAEIDTNW